MPKVVVSSTSVSKIPVGKAGLRPNEVMPLSIRMESDEKVLEKLSLAMVSFTEKFSNARVVQSNFLQRTNRQEAIVASVSVPNGVTALQVPTLQSEVSSYAKIAAGQSKPTFI